MPNRSVTDESKSITTHPIRGAWDEFDIRRFDDWIINFSDVYLRSGIELRQAARIIDVRPAVVQAALNLATLDEESLNELASLKPAKTTWFLLAAADNKALVAAVSVLTNMSPDEPRPSVIVSEAIREVEGPSTLERVSGLTSGAFNYAYRAAVAYDALSDKSRKALKRFAGLKKTGGIMTAKQSAYAQDLLRQLIAVGAINKKDSAENNQNVDEIFSALGVMD